MSSDGSGVDSVPDKQRVDQTLKTVVPADPDVGNGNQKAATESAEWDEDGVNLCQFFLLGKCHFGQRCRLSHSDPLMDESGAVSSDQDDKRHQEKMEKQKKKEKKTKPEYEAKEVNKKPRMRTADDVISRILWDPSVEASEFVVGYVDRFLGVLERPFNDFNWDTNPCDCDYSVELALPRHRIQYFTYRGHRVWDRHSRTDKVFGSTGQSLAPPFGGKGELKAEQDQQQDHKTTEDSPVVWGQEGSETEKCTQTKNTHLEEEKPFEMNTHTLDVTQLAPKCGAKAMLEKQESHGAYDTQEATNRPMASTDQMSFSKKEEASIKEMADAEPLEEWQEGWEGSGDASSCLGALNISQKCSPFEQSEEKPHGRLPKKRPTHFITFRANTPAILSCFKQLQEEIISLLPSSVPHWNASANLHVTLCLLVLAGPADVAAAVEILQRFAELDRNPPVSLTFPVKLKHFGGRVLLLSPQPQLHLQQLNSGMQEAYRTKGLLHRDSYNPRYHLTLAKVKDREVDRIFEGVGDLKVGKGLNFGRLPVNTLHLCTMEISKLDGFYETVCTVTLR